MDRRDPPEGQPRRSAQAEADLLDGLASQDVLETFEDLAAPIPVQFVQPYVAVDGNEEGAPDEARRLGVGSDDGVEGPGPDLEDLGLGLLALEVESLEHTGQHVADRPTPDFPGLLQFGQVDPTPLGDRLAAGPCR